MKPKSSRLFVPPLLSIAVIVVALNAWLAFHSVTSLVKSEFWVEHTWQVINQVERIMGSAKDAETGSRGYLITGDSSYLAPYAAAQGELPRELDRLRGLVADNPKQQKRIAEMHGVIEQRLLLLEQGIDLRRSGGADSARALVLSGTGKTEMDRLRQMADTMESEERGLLALRTATAKSDSSKARYAVALASGMDLLLILLAFQYFTRERNLRLAAEMTGERLAVARAEADARTEEVRSLNATLEERVTVRTAELERINRELEAFSYSVSHDLRAPLRTIDGFSLALKEDYADAVDDVGRDYIQRVRNGVQRMGQLIDALLLLSRVTRTEIVREEFDLSGMAESIAVELKEQNREREIHFHIEGGLHAFADSRLMQVALENLLGNAVKFSSKISMAEIRFGWDAEPHAWYVRDNGAGFDMIYAKKLFSAFNRLHGDKDFKGSGIGLATVARVIHGHHGRIWASSAVDQGATFWFTLGEASLESEE